MGLLGKREIFLTVADFLWSSFVVVPFVVLFWRGTWDILGDLVYPELPVKEGIEDAPENISRRQLTGIVCYLFGLFMRIFLDLGKFHLGEYLSKQPALLRMLGGLVYTGVYAFSGVAFWRGIWHLMIQDVGEKTTQLMVVLVGSLLVLLFSKVSRSLISSPLALCLDTHANTFANTSYFKRSPEAKGWFVVDVIFTNLVVRQLIVFCWWSLWSLENSFLINNQIGERDSYVSYDSVLMGYAAATLAYTLDKLIMKSTSTKQYITKPLQYLVTVIAFFGSVNVWRGVWSVYDNFLFPGIGKELNYLVSLCVGFLVLSVMLLSNTICSDHIASDFDEGEIVNIKYWEKKKVESDSDEMIPIVE